MSRLLARLSGVFGLFVALAVMIPSSPGWSQDKPETSEIRIGLIGIADNTPAFIADRLGYFADEGLTAKFNQFPGGATAQQALIAGRIDFLHTNAVSILLARAQGFNISIVSNNSVTRAAAPDAGRLLVKAGGSVQNPKDLEGKKIAVNLLNNTIWLAVHAWLEKKGVDPKKVTFQEVPFPQMIDALVNDRVDAVAIVEPFGTIAQDTGKTKVLGYYYVEVNPSWELAGMVAMEEWIKKNPATVRKFVKAFRRGVDFMNENPAEARKFIVEYTKLNPALADRILLNVMATRSNPASLQLWEDLMLKSGLLKQPVGVKSILAPSALE